MNDVYTITAVGRLGKDADLKYTNDGTPVVNFSMAVNRSKKVQGQWTDVADWWKVEMFGKRAESVNQYLVKGKQVAVTGSPAIERWTDQENKDHTMPTIRADHIQLLGGGQQGQGSDGGQGGGSWSGQSDDPGRPRNGYQGQQGGRQGPPPNDEFTDDIPF